jgi:hypothetical protein
MVDNPAQGSHCFALIDGNESSSVWTIIVRGSVARAEKTLGWSARIYFRDKFWHSVWRLFMLMGYILGVGGQVRLFIMSSQKQIGM